MNIVYPRSKKVLRLQYISGLNANCPINMFGGTGKNYSGRVLLVDVEYNDLLNLFLKPISRRGI